MSELGGEEARSHVIVEGGYTAGVTVQTSRSQELLTGKDVRHRISFSGDNKHRSSCAYRTGSASRYFPSEKRRASLSSVRAALL